MIILRCKMQFTIKLYCSCSSVPMVKKTKNKWVSRVVLANFCNQNESRVAFVRWPVSVSKLLVVRRWFQWVIASWPTWNFMRTISYSGGSHFYGQHGKRLWKIKKQCHCESYLNLHDPKSTYQQSQGLTKFLLHSQCFTNCCGKRSSTCVLGWKWRWNFV